ncbi:MAG: thiamine phosphate synthase [Sphingomonadaceae bacterium]
MDQGQTLPLLWLLSDQRNDADLERALARLPNGSGFVFRHYHLDEERRRARFERLSDCARDHGHRVILAGNIRDCAAWRADGVYGAVEGVARHTGGLRLGTAHNGDELQAANRARLDGVFLSPVFPTRSHPGAAVLGIQGFQVLAQQALIPVIALGGMTSARARALNWPRWGAIDGLA